MKHILITLSLLSTLIFTTGCSIISKYKVTIDAITAPNVALTPSTYAIQALNKNKNSQGLVFSNTLEN